jgi:hypothetical protein
MMLATGLPSLTPVRSWAATDYDGTVAYISVQDYKNGMSSPSGAVEMAALLDAIINGTQWSNAALANHNEALLYCTPDKLALTQDEEVAIVNNYIHENNTAGSWPLGLIALNAMQATFPCPASQ